MQTDSQGPLVKKILCVNNFFFSKVNNLLGGSQSWKYKGLSRPGGTDCQATLQVTAVVVLGWGPESVHLPGANLRATAQDQFCRSGFPELVV